MFAQAPSIRSRCALLQGWKGGAAGNLGRARQAWYMGRMSASPSCLAPQRVFVYRPSSRADQPLRCSGPVLKARFPARAAVSCRPGQIRSYMPPARRPWSLKGLASFRHVRRTRCQSSMKDIDAHDPFVALAKLSTAEGGRVLTGFPLYSESQQPSLIIISATNAYSVYFASLVLLQPTLTIHPESW